MLFKKVCNILIHIIAILCSATCQSDRHEVDIVCTEVKLMELSHVGQLQTCISNSTRPSVTEFNTNVRNVLYVDGTIVATDLIEALYFAASQELNLLPNGIKESFPNLKALIVQNSVLKHIDQQDMEQFGSDLLMVQFYDSELTALKGNVFMHNPNLVYVDFEKSPLKFIDPELFENFKQMESLKEIDLSNCGCINKRYEKSVGHEIEGFQWNAECNDVFALISNNERIHSREAIANEERLGAIINDNNDVRSELKKEVAKLRSALNDVITKVAKINAREW